MVFCITTLLSPVVIVRKYRFILFFVVIIIDMTIMIVIGCFLQDTHPSRIVKNAWKLYESESSRTMRQQTAIANPEPLKTQSNTHILDLSLSTSWATKKPNISRRDFERNISPQILSNISSTSSICFSCSYFWAKGHGDLCLPTDVPARRFWSHAPRKENRQESRECNDCFIICVMLWNESLKKL